MTTTTQTVAFGDRWVYTTPTGHRIPHTVTQIDLKPKYQHEPGNCVRLVADDLIMKDSVMWARHLFDEPYWQPGS